MNRIALIHRTSPLLSTVALTCAWLCAAAAAGQTPPSKPDASSATSNPKAATNEVNPPAVLQIYKLQHVDARSVIPMLERLLDAKESRVVFDGGRSALIVSAPRNLQERVAEIVQMLDAPTGREHSEQIRVFTLANVDPESAAKVLRAMVPNLRMATEQRTRSVLASGSADDLAAVEALVTQLDRGSDSVASYEVRVYWLASGMTEGHRGLPPADDLKDVVAELSRHGVTDLRQVGEIAVQTMTGRDRSGRFHVKGSPRFGDQPAEFSAQGVLSKVPDGALGMEVAISTRTGSSPPDQKLNDVQTQIVLPEKQYVVLAAAPTGNQTSVFVVQVVRSDKPTEKKDGKPGQVSPRR